MKRALIIGATSGIGKSLTEILLREQYMVGIAGRREEELYAIQKGQEERVFPQRLDIHELSTIESICNQLTTQMGGLDLVIYASGIGEENSTLNFAIDHDVIKTNVLGFTSVANWALTYFKQQGHGHFVNISSIAGIRGNGLAPSYNATKAYQINYTEGLRLNVKEFGPSIVVTDVRPGFVDTAMAKGDGLFWVAPVHKAAEQIFSAI